MPVAADSLHAVLDRLADYESDSASVVSVYLDLKPEQAGQSFKAFLEAAMKEHEGIRQDIERIREYLETEKPSSQGLAVFSSSGEPGLFEAVPVEAPVGGHRLYIDREPHVFPLDELDEAAIEELVTLARRTDAGIKFIEDASLLAPARHVGATLRYRV